MKKRRKAERVKTSLRIHDAMIHWEIRYWTYDLGEKCDTMYYSAFIGVFRLIRYRVLPIKQEFEDAFTNNRIKVNAADSLAVPRADSWS